MAVSKIQFAINDPIVNIFSERLGIDHITFFLGYDGHFSKSILR